MNWPSFFAKKNNKNQIVFRELPVPRDERPVVRKKKVLFRKKMR